MDEPLAGARVFPKPDFCKTVRKRSCALGRRVQALPAGSVSQLATCLYGTAARPASFSLGGTKKLPLGSHITMIQCEEGWSYIAEWTGVPLSHPWNASPLPRKCVTWSTVRSNRTGDVADALHPQTLLTYEMNGGELPVGFGGPLRMRISRQLGYKSLKYVTQLTMTDNIKQFGKGLGSAEPEAGYAWYACA